jgi:hypothetical protein
LNVAYDELMQWGPRLGMPLLPRLRERLPGLDDAVLRRLQQECERAQVWANALGERAYGGELTQDDARGQLLEHFAWVDDANASHALSQGMYYAWHG